MNDTPPDLSEKNFIQEGMQKNPYPFFLWSLIVAALLLTLSLGFSWYAKKIVSEYSENKFLQVTNREMSLFLWQNPEFMRVNVSKKTVYMPAFQYLDKITIEPGLADDFVMAPPEVIFRYHCWHRLLGQVFIPRAIDKREFTDFLSYAEEWRPDFWPSAPASYREMMVHLDAYEGDLYPALPSEVRQAFIGWKNYFFDREAINELAPTREQVQSFLTLYPHFSRNYWVNIVGAKYLASMSSEESDPAFGDELAPFLRVNLYNYLLLASPINLSR